MISQTETIYTEVTQSEIGTETVQEDFSETADDFDVSEVCLDSSSSDDDSEDSFFEMEEDSTSED